MNINLDPKPLSRFKHGRLVESLYDFDVKWIHPDEVGQPFKADEKEVNRLKNAIKANNRLEPIVVLKDYGIVAGVHLLEAFRRLKYDRIPVMFGKQK